ncbi:hypothetical protein [Falsiroseomonas sp.]|uniref:hypothetical protein n=1 Tax=Falsiroseomonas sp. TaxID=2870721 RepID=UPI00271FA07B|nr:hypothetical protein [Falsiroseomonas sp.]MDO9499028.1 hypothetical protein [Falsiroseomonas sp.]
MTAAAAAAADPAEDLLYRRMKALAEAELDAREWDEQFIADVCFRPSPSLTPRQARMVEVLCWRYRALLPAEVVPATEPPKAFPR